MAAKKKIAAKATPAKDRFPVLHRRYHVHNPDAGRNVTREVLVNTATPQSKPNAIHGITPSRFSNSNANQKIIASKQAARLVSHTQRVDQYMTVGNSAQPHALQTATFSLKHFRAIKKIGMHVNAEKILLMVRRMNAEACE
jgi:hypothetical protein